ncbi:uncharacterized protein PAC_13577 [Phialocephala subalpina]|uniref:2EXR domain-containing protein n=1 Tax=Phialocephala subalpina TaxID=576137 RepID=A0A1L7XF62_9HELO|nr:uncharacterized protein PAC_13577 [Phialocephala subalpina]
MVPPAPLVVHSNPSMNYPSFTKFPELPAELRLKVWRRSFQTRVVQIYIFEKPQPRGGNQPQTCTLEVTVACAQGQPPALSVCKESRDVALERYAPLLPAEIFDINTGLKARVQTEYDDALILGSTRMMMDPQIDTLSIGNLCAARVLTSFLPAQNLKHLVLARGARGLFSRLDLDWSQLSTDFPNLKKLSLMFGFQCKPLPGPPTTQKQLLVPMDCSLIDMCMFTDEVCELEGREIKGIDKVFWEMAQSLRNKRKFWIFVLGDQAPQTWKDMAFETFYDVVKTGTPHGPVLVIPRLERVTSLEQLPEGFQEEYSNETFPAHVWFGIPIADERGEFLDHRYMGMDALFRKPGDE